MLLRFPTCSTIERGDNSTMTNSNVVSNNLSDSHVLKDKKEQSLLRNLIDVDFKSLAPPSPVHHCAVPQLKWFSHMFHGKQNDKVGPAMAVLTDIAFDVTKINQKDKKQSRRLLLSANGISNIRPGNNVSSREKWSDVLICYKIEQSTIAIKYTNYERKYNARSKTEADNLLFSLRERVNAFQKDARRELQKSMVDGFDEKARFEAVPIIRKKYQKFQNEDEIRKCVEQILLSRNSDFFKLKERICRCALTEFGKVKQLRRALNSLKFSLFDDNMNKLSDVTNTNDPEVNNHTLSVIESMIESACLPCHTDDIYKLLEKETRCSNNQVMTKVFLLCEKTQIFFGIKRTLQSKDKWITAVAELMNFPKNLLPSGKMECLLNTARHIHQQAKLMYRKDITADDLLPIVIFVLVKASYNAGKIIITASDELFIEYLIDPEALNGETGYYFCVFRAALEFIRNYDRKNIDGRFSTIHRLKDWGFC